MLGLNECVNAYYRLTPMKSKDMGLLPCIAIAYAIRCRGHRPMSIINYVSTNEKR